MEITKELLLYVKGLTEQRDALQIKLTQTKTNGKMSSLRKDIIGLNNKILSTQTKMRERVYAPVNMVYIKTMYEGVPHYYKRILALTEREIHIMYQVANTFRESPGELDTEIVTIIPINPSPQKCSYEETKIQKQNNQNNFKPH